MHRNISVYEDGDYKFNISYGVETITISKQPLTKDGEYDDITLPHNIMAAVVNDIDKNYEYELDSDADLDNIEVIPYTDNKDEK